MSFRKHIILTVLVRIIRLFGGFGVTLILARVLKPEGMGSLATFLAIPIILYSLAEMGISQSIASRVGKNSDAAERVTGTVCTIWLLTSLVSMPIVLLIYYYQGLFRHGWYPCLFGALIVPANLIMRYANGIAIGRQWISMINAGEMWNLILRLILSVVLVLLLRLSVAGALLMNVISFMLPGFILVCWIIKKLKVQVRFSFDRELIWNLLFHGAKYALALFLITMNYRINILILQKYVDETQIGYFSVGIQLAELIWLLPMAVGLVIFSYSTTAKVSHEYSMKVVQAMRLNLLLCGLGAGLMALVCPFFIRIIFGAEYLPAVPAILWLLPGIVAMVIFKILRVDMAGRGKPLFAFPTVLATLLINLVLNFLLVPRYGIQGSSIAITVSYVFGSLGLMIYYSRETGISVRSMFLDIREDKRLFAESVSSLRLRLKSLKNRAILYRKSKGLI